MVRRIFKNFISLKAAILGLSTVMLFVGIVGVAHTAGMQLNEQGEMRGCIFTGEIMLCEMNIMEHVSLWQSIFTATPQRINIFALLLSLTTLFVGAFILNRHLVNFLRRKFSLLKLYQNQHPNSIFFDRLQYALAQGILHPRIYEPAYI